MQGIWVSPSHLVLKSVKTVIQSYLLWWPFVNKGADESHFTFKVDIWWKVLSFRENYRIVSKLKC